jgi:penicillin-binding protein 1A
LKKLALAMFDDLRKVFSFWFSIFMLALIIMGLTLIPLLAYMGKDLPDYNHLMDYTPPTISRMYSFDGRLMSELAEEKRVFRPIDQIPDLIKQAFISAEDQNFYHHPGIDVLSIMRASMHNIVNYGTDRNLIGGSTITQQVVKNFLLTNEKTFARKVKEAILAYRISQVYSKDKILEIYLNQIYLGNGAYGVVMASLSYFNKDLNDLSIEEAALLAGLPQAPSSLDPTKHLDKATIRRNKIISRMLEEGYISEEQATAAIEKPIVLNNRWEAATLDNGYYAETVRLELLNHFGHDYLYKEGISIFTNLDVKLQKFADDSLKAGLIRYDRKHGYRGAIGTINNLKNWQAELKAYPIPLGIGSWKLATVLSISDNSATIGYANGQKVNLPLANLKWARKALANANVGKEIHAVKDVLDVGDIIITGNNGEGVTLEQIPEVNGSIIVMQPRTGKVLALSGGYSFKDSKYNRAVQAMRQPGSAFKPFVYLTALERGYSPFTIITDEPISINVGPKQAQWTPKNYGGKFLGPITLRQAIEKSRNIPTVKLISKIGPKAVAENAFKFGIYDKLPPEHYSMALGAIETTPLKITSAYATFASNGIMIKPKLIDRIVDRSGKIIYYPENIACDSCGLDSDEGEETVDFPSISYKSQYLLSPEINYQIVSLLEGVVQHGTGVKAKSLNKTIALKTGTSNDSMDTWTIGFTPDIVCSVYVGFDRPKTLGSKEEGSSLALPIFVDFMSKALADMNDKHFQVPSGLAFYDLDTIAALTNIDLENKLKTPGKEAITSLQFNTFPQHLELKAEDVFEGEENQDYIPRSWIFQ